MSALARLLRAAGATVTGSDRAASATTDALAAEGFTLALEQHARSLPAALDLLVISAAIRPDHPEVAAARERGVPVIKYAEALGRLMAGYTGVAVAGTHGKSTTTAMLSHCLIQAGRDPSLIVGAQCPQIGGGWRVGRSPLLVAEACEFDRSFLHLEPVHAIVLNIEADHLDVYGSIDQIVEAFGRFTARLPPQGSLLVQHESPHRMAVSGGVACPVETIGFAPQADWQLRFEAEAPGGARVEVRRDGRAVACWAAPLAGEHMAYNQVAAGVMAHRLGVGWPVIESALAGFTGVARRMQWLGKRRVAGGEVDVVDDYAHHPTEIDATLRALRRHYRPGRLVCVFQPHQHSRTRFLMEAFAESFSAADLVMVPEIYFVRDSERERQQVTARDLVAALVARGAEAEYAGDLDRIPGRLAGRVRAGDLVVSMGAGDVWRVAQRFLSGP